MQGGGNTGGNLANQSDLRSRSRSWSVWYDVVSWELDGCTISGLLICREKSRSSSKSMLSMCPTSLLNARMVVKFSFKERNVKVRMQERNLRVWNIQIVNALVGGLSGMIHRGSLSQCRTQL